MFVDGALEAGAPGQFSAAGNRNNNKRSSGRHNRPQICLAAAQEGVDHSCFKPGDL
jgi:hypothetical protein